MIEYLDSMMQVAFKVRKENFPMEVFFDKPDMTVPVSVTGQECLLSCAHCDKVYLKHMTTIDKVGEKINKTKATSILLSGGCDTSGSVVFGKEAVQIARSLTNSGVRVNMHTGLVSKDLPLDILAYADCVSFDFSVDQDTIREVYGINKTGSDYIASYKLLRERTRVVPHICIGLYKGLIKGEYEALTALKELGVDMIVFIIFMPTKGTRFAKCEPPAIDEVIKLLTYARSQFPDIPLQLGCMRPGGKYRSEIDVAAIRCGVNKIVNPSSTAVAEAEKLGLVARFGRECCVL